jgi:hypothetical protein
MICYRDMTFCRESSCAKFGDGDNDCHRSLTVAVEHMAEHWWNGTKEERTEAPVAVFVERPDCYAIQA